MKKFFKEFKEFALRGNVMDLAVGVIIGAAFQAIVNSLVADIISPVIGLFAKSNFDSLYFQVPGSEVKIMYGQFITAVINFIIMALVIFLLVKLLNKLTTIGKKEEKKDPTTKKCPYCFTEIPIQATRCPDCTSQLPEAEAETKK